MSYDLYLSPKTFDANAIRAYFAARPHYEVSDAQAFYSNADTGVYFIFDFVEQPGDSDEEIEGVQAAPHVAFNLNYFRPHIFALEAEPELAAFVEALACTVDDPQIDGMGSGAYSRDRFFSGWTAGNRFSAQAIGEDGGELPPSADGAQIEEAWAWNFNRARLQDHIGDNTFVPKIAWVRPGADMEPVRCATWTFGVPTAIPDSMITHVVLVRQARPTLAGMFSRKNDGPKMEVKLLSVEGGIRLRGVERGEIEGRPVL